MDEKLNRVENKLDKLDDRLDQMTITLVKNTEVLEYHIKRTDLLEEQVQPLKKDMDTAKTVLKVLKWIGVGAVGMLGILVSLKELGIL